MQLHLHNHLFCFSATIIHFFMMHKVYTLSTKHAWNKRNKTTTSIVCVVDKENLNRHRAGSFIFFLYFHHLSYFMGTVFIVESCSSTFDEYKSLHHKFVFCFRKDLWWNPGHAGINRPLPFSSVVSQQFQYFHKLFLNKVQKKEKYLTLKTKNLKTQLLETLSWMWANLCHWPKKVWENPGVSLQPSLNLDQTWEHQLLSSARLLSHS